MARARDFNGSANETIVVSPKDVKGKVKDSILGKKARLWLLTINNPQNHGISLEQQEILERLKEDIASGAVTYVSSVMEQSLTTDENGKHTPHGHIAVYYPPQTHGGHLQKIFPMAALQNCNASILSVRQYLLKDPTGKWYQTHPEKFGEKLPDAEANFWEWGLLPDGKRKTPDSPTAKTLGEDVLQAIGDGKSDAEIMTLYPTIWNRSGELRKIRFLIMSQKFRPVYRDLNCIYIEANFPPKQIYKLFSHTSDTYVVSDYTHPWDSYCAETTVVLTEYLGQFPWQDMRRLLSGNYCTLPARFSDAVACYENIIIISPLRIDDLCNCGKGYVSSVFTSYLTNFRRYLDIDDVGTDYVLNILRNEDNKLILGRGLTGDVIVDIDKTPHILIGGNTGSGKSVLVQCLLWQAIQQADVVYVADFKGGVDFSYVWQEFAYIITEETKLLVLLNHLADTLEERKRLFKEVDAANITEYREKSGDYMQRIVFACDEVAELLDKTGADKARKELLAQIEARLALIARQGRAFGIHLILATQRPDANILPGQIKNNMNIRICGRADTTLSTIIIGDGRAAEQIPHDAQGRFIMEDGTVFQAYYFNDDTISKW